MFSLKHLRLREQRRQPFQNFPQKAPQPTALKPPSTARTAGRSDWAERRFRRQSFILLSFSSSKKARKAQETQSYQRFQCIGHTDFKTSGTNGSRLFSQVKAGTRSPSPTGSHTAAYTAKQGRFGWGRYHYPRSVLRGSETLRGRVSERRTLPLLGLGQVCSRRAQRAFGTAMRSCASLFRGVAAPLGCVIPLLFLSPHRWASRFCLSMITARKEYICCFTRWSAPCVLPLAAVPLPCPQHPSAADKTGRWKTGSAGSCRADFRFACARPS